MNANNIAVWVGIIVAILGGGVSYGVSSEKISQLETKVADQQELVVKTAVMEERQKVIKDSVEKTEQSVERIEHLLQELSK